MLSSATKTTFENDNLRTF